MSIASLCELGRMKDAATWVLRVGRTERAPCRRQAEKRAPATSDTQLWNVGRRRPLQGAGAPRSDRQSGLVLVVAGVVAMTLPHGTWKRIRATISGR